MGQFKRRERRRSGAGLLSILAMLSLAGQAAAPGPRQAALAAFKRGHTAGQQGDLTTARREIERAAEWRPARDAATAALVELEAQHHKWRAVLTAADRYPLAHADPFYNRIAQPAAEAAHVLKRWHEAQKWGRRMGGGPEALWLRAWAAAELGDTRAAAVLERELIYNYPASSRAREVESAWRRHLRAMPDVKPGWRLMAARAAGWQRAGETAEAARAWRRARMEAPGKERPRLEMQEARAWRRTGHLSTARILVRWLLTGPERAQALELEVELARAGGSPADFDAPLAALGHEFPKSRWYAMALDQAGNSALIGADDAHVQQWFDLLVRQFPDSGYAPIAAWQAAWVSYRQGKADTPMRLEAVLRRYPNAAPAVDALYWRGMWAQTHHQEAMAQACFRAAAERFPGRYFGYRARQRIRGNPAAAGAPPWLEAFADDPPTPKATPAPAAMRYDLQRAAWLSAAGLPDAAAPILQHVLEAEPAGTPSLETARRLARVDGERQAWGGGIDAMIRALPNYLELQPNQLPMADWKRLFPAPYPEATAAARREGLDRNLLLGLIRQESEFNSGAISSARARGLMQLELATARGLAGRRLRAQQLLEPALNIRLGSAFLKHLLNRFHEPALALAGYNAGGRRVAEWEQLHPIGDTDAGLDEFIESIPFTQTRVYVKAVLRNQAHYARIYGADGVAVAAALANSRAK